MNNLIEKTLRFTEKLIPKKIFSFFNPAYHYFMALAGAVIYRFPSRKIKLIGITGTKGKSSTVEILSAILEEAGYKTALTNTIRFKIGEESEDNMYKMSMPGRFTMQRFLRRAVEAKCDYAIIEMTSQGSITFRHRFMEMNGFIFTNLSPEHIEAHGSYENYREAKLNIARNLARSNKKDKIMVVNGDDKESPLFLNIPADRKMTFSIKDASPYTLLKEGSDYTYSGISIHSNLSGIFNIYNILAASTMAKALGVDASIIKRAVEKFHGIRGRLEKIDVGQDFYVVVDYAHTPDSLEKVYQVYQNTRKICLLGNTGGGRDKWKRKVMAEIADKYCDEIILANEDPYDEDPMSIVTDMKNAIHGGRAEIIIDRREAINKAISLAHTGDTVIITGKGTDPYIMGANGNKEPWSDARVAREELEKVLSKKLS
jgi:UDP-N-acetylmuramoyl-L-alanyl-D-glutamate--2,6-diaminopimelate ligase